MKIKYIKFDCPDGIGSQIIVYDKIIRFSKKYNLIPIIDFSSMCYFRGKKFGFNKNIFDNLFSVNESIIYDPDLVREIDDKLVLKIKNKKVSNLDESTEYCNLLDSYYKFKSKGVVDLFIQPTINLKNFSDRIRECVGVHIRFGNGEFDRHGFHRKIDKKSLDKKLDYIFSKNNSFYVCSDTKSLLDEIKLKYNKKIILYDRIHIEEGHGPGHNIKPCNKENFKEETEHEILRDAVIEIILLSKTRKVYHTGGCFPKYAIRSGISDEKIFDWSW
tara:strand:+ start:75 stop:896 length:822 start_codon:yes stop_codon:yes gene_type:complete